ncbi:AAA family ATPase [Oerskovia enterophila]|uniref:AAA family ATPase n=1 Tax=Oerskovia enterophila TaxID=43678 RepID=UPI00382F4B3F
MIEGLRIKGFKRFLDQEFSFSRLNVLTGLNGSGKSTVLQAILLSHSAARGVGIQAIGLNPSDGVGLGGASDVLNTFSSTDQIAITVWNGDHRAEVTLECGPGDSSGMRTSIPISGIIGDFPSPLGRSGLFQYLGAERLGPKLFYPVAVDGISEIAVGGDGSLTANVLANQGRAVVPEKRRHGSQTTVTTLGAQAEAWLSQMVGATRIRTSLLPRLPLATLEFKGPDVGDEWTLPVNTGFGFSYCLPVIVAGLVVPEGGILIVDSPEAHLHPAAQSAMGEFLANVASDGVQVFVETHSDHVLNGIRRSLIRREALNVGDVEVLFFSKEAVTRVEVNSRAAMRPMPPGFFDQIELDLAQIVRGRPGGAG